MGNDTYLFVNQKNKNEYEKKRFSEIERAHRG